MKRGPKKGANLFASVALTITNNILIGFRETRLALFNLEAIILKLNMRLRTLLLPSINNTL
jgi:hypothetical protein